MVSNATMDLMIPAMVVAALRHGVYLSVISADFGQVAQEAFDAQSMLNQSQLDYVLLALDYRAFDFSSNTFAAVAPGVTAQDVCDYLCQLTTAFRQHSGVASIVQTLVSPPYSLMGSIDRSTQGSLRRGIAETNQLIDSLTENSPDLLFDVEGLAAELGTYQWFDQRQWLMSRIPMDNRFVPIYADRLGRILGAARGKSKKCLVLDLDNTLWGGVIGDDGIDGIVLGQGNPRGEAHLALQQYALELKKQGVVLAICSKNEETNARQPFLEHPDMLLKESDIAVFVANWQDKASNLKEIATQLNIGLDALVFVDDNPAEREIVRQFTPEVSVPELPSDVALYAKTVASAGYFEMIAFTKEDSLRAKQYSQNAVRSSLMASSENISEFLESLAMEVEFSDFDDFGRQRITQLINKTNQFNLTTKRYTESEILQFQHDCNVMTLQVRMKDRFGENGMVSVVICKKGASNWHIDTWLMSCRVIKRKLEEAVCDEVIRRAKADGIETISGCYIPTAKNDLVRNHYQELGFTPFENVESEDKWQLTVTDYKSKKPPITVKW